LDNAKPLEDVRSNFCGLHLGCGSHRLEGWINADIEPSAATCVTFDARRRFPFPDNAFDAVFSEHMLEHLTFTDGMVALQECWRVLKPGGRLRISTPDLAFLIKLYTGPRSPLEDDYLSWAALEFGGRPPAEVAIFVVNNFVRAWGHLFIYDEPTLSSSLRKVGFDSIESCQLGQSSHPRFRGVENVGRLPTGYLQLESMSLEAAKPTGSKEGE